MYLIFIGPKYDYWLPLSVTNSLTNVVETNLMWPWRGKMPTQYSLILLLSLMRNVLATVWLRFWRWRLFKISTLRFGQDFEVEVQLRCWSWSLVKILKLKFGQDAEAEVWSRFLAKDWSTFWARSLGEIWKLKLGRASKAHLWHDLKEFILVKACNPWVCCAFGNVST